MAWTDPDLQHRRSREELLADVIRRGGRIRHRRRTAAALVSVIVLVVPVTALLTVAREPERDVRVTAAGPEAPPALPSSDVGPGPADAAVDVSTTTLAPVDAGPASPPPTVGRLSSPSTTAARAAPTNDDPVVRAAPSVTLTTLASGGGAGAGPPGGATSSPPMGTGPGSGTGAALAACPVAQVSVTVTFEKASYSPGETVRWSSTLENRSGTTCMVSGRAYFHVENSAGATVGAFAYTADYMLPVKAEPGKTITNGFAWDQKNCSNGPCAQVPAGTYVVVADWSEGGPYSGRGSFRIAS